MKVTVSILFNMKYLHNYRYVGMLCMNLHKVTWSKINNNIYDLFANV